MSKVTDKEDNKPVSLADLRKGDFFRAKVIGQTGDTAFGLWWIDEFDEAANPRMFRISASDGLASVSRRGFSELCDVEIIAGQIPLDMFLYVSDLVVKMVHLREAITKVCGSATTAECTLQATREL